MSNFPSHTLTTEKFLTVATNILHKAFVEGSRTSAKNVYSSIVDGKRVSLVTLKMDDDSESRVDVTLDHSEFRGKLNFGVFKSILTHMLVQIAEFVKSEKQVPVFTDEESGNLLFGVPGIFDNKGEINALLLGADLGGQGLIHLQLQFVEPDQFFTTEPPAEDTGGDGPTAQA